MNKDQIILIVLIGCIVLNTIVHFSHPAYKYYRENIERYNQEISHFRERVKNDFVPSILLAVTNNSQKSSPINSNEVSTLSSPFKIEQLSADYGEVGGQPFIRFQKLNLFAGDDLFGSRIISIRPTFLTTENCQFRIVPNSVNSSPVDLDRSAAKSPNNIKGIK